jgi:hypothetical protein
MLGRPSKAKSASFFSTINQANMKTLLNIFLKVIKWTGLCVLALFVLAVIAGNREASAPPVVAAASPTPAPAPVPVAESTPVVAAKAVAVASAATPDPRRTNPTEEDKAEAREIARTIAREEMVRVAEDVDVLKAMERRSKHGTGATIEEVTAAFAGSEYPDNAALRAWFCDYVPPVVKRIMMASRDVAEKYGANGVRRYFMILKDHPEDLKAWAFEAHHGALGALKDPLADEEAFDYLRYKWVLSYAEGREEGSYKNMSQSEGLAEVKTSCTEDAAEAYPKNKAKRIECTEKLYKAVYGTLEKRGLIKPQA